jgi:HEPN domain-containing protein
MVARETDLTPNQFHQHLRAVDKIQLLTEKREAAGCGDIEVETLAADFAHCADAANLHMEAWEIPVEFRQFVYVIIGAAGDRAATAEWFDATDEILALRANKKSTKTIQNWRRDYLAWAKDVNYGGIQVKSNWKDKAGNWHPHSYSVHVALVAAKTALNAYHSDGWQENPGKAKEEVAVLMRDSVPEVAPYNNRKGQKRNDALASVNTGLKLAATKVRKAVEMQKLTGNNLVPDGDTIQRYHELKALLAEFGQAFNLDSTKEEEIQAQEEGVLSSAGEVEVFSTPPSNSSSESDLREASETPTGSVASGVNCVSCGSLLSKKQREVNSELCGKCDSLQHDVYLGPPPARGPDKDLNELSPEGKRALGLFNQLDKARGKRE